MAPARWRSWFERAALVVLSPIVAFLLIEGCLRIVGYGYPTSFLVPAQETGKLITNEGFAWQFYSRSSPLKPFLFTLASKKPAGTIRICVLGESAAMGTPDPAFGLGRILEVTLRRNYPDQQFEVINAAMRGINSHIIRLIAREFLSKQIDYFVVYMGNNEVVGFHAPDPDSPRWTQSLTFIRAVQWLRSCRLGQGVESLKSRLVRSPDEGQPQDMAFFHRHRVPADDWRRQKVGENFAANLEDICRATTDRGAKVVLATVAVNLEDCPPLGSLHRAGLSAREQDRWDQAFHEGMKMEGQGRLQEAVAAYESAAQIDDHFAELQFHLGRCYLGSGDTAQARRHYELARDWDATQFRADARINQIIRRLAARWQGRGVMPADVEGAFADSPLSDRGLPGEQLFTDHVHPTFAGNYLLARTVYAQLVSVLEQALGRKAQGAFPTLEECAQAVPYTLYNDLNVVAAMVRLTACPPFLDQVDHLQRQQTSEARIEARLAAFKPEEAEASVRTYENVVRLEPEYWPARFNLAMLCEELRRFPEATEQLQHLARRFPAHSAFSLELAGALLKSGNRASAVVELREAVRKNPTDKALATALRTLDQSN